MLAKWYYIGWTPLVIGVFGIIMTILWDIINERDLDFGTFQIKVIWYSVIMMVVGVVFLIIERNAESKVTYPSEITWFIPTMVRQPLYQFLEKNEKDLIFQITLQIGVLLFSGTLAAISLILIDFAKKEPALEFWPALLLLTLFIAFFIYISRVIRWVVMEFERRACARRKSWKKI